MLRKTASAALAAGTLVGVLAVAVPSAGAATGTTSTTTTTAPSTTTTKPRSTTTTKPAPATTTTTTTTAPGNAGGNTNTVTWAQQPDSSPNYIFPFMGAAHFTVANTGQFQDLLYRPLYWFGNGNQPTLNPSLSLASQPLFSKGNTVITVSLLPYSWSNGEKVTATDVLFWMNMLHAERSHWAAYTKGGFPDNVRHVTVNSPTKLTFTLKQGYNSYWFTYNQLSQITPLPLAWDKTSLSAKAGSGGCAKATYGTADGKCQAVYNFLSSQAGKSPTTYATSALWKVVDGPWKLTQLTKAGKVTFAANPHYGGTTKPTITTFVELPFTSDKAEFQALANGTVDVGYLPAANVTAPTTNALVPGPNNPKLKANYTLSPLYTWSINYFPYNFTSTGSDGNAGKLFKQLYIRQAFQMLINQPQLIKTYYKGYAVPTYGPVPISPANPFSDPTDALNVYPYNPTKAAALLKGHGWKVKAKGTSTCQKPGSKKDECGKGIPKGATLSFSLQYASGSATLSSLMHAEKTSWAQAGIHVSLSTASFSTVTNTATACPDGCSWELQNSGAGWVFAPDYYPSGETLFASGAASNAGSYSDPTTDKLIKQAYLTNGNLDQYEDYLAKQLPVVYQPNGVTSLTEIKKSLQGVNPQNPMWALTPELWRFTS